MQDPTSSVDLPLGDAMGGVLIFTLERAEDLDLAVGGWESWLPGPLPVRLPVREDLKDRLTAEATTAEARLTAVDGGAGSLLYSTSPDIRPGELMSGRNHILDISWRLDSLTFFAAEFLGHNPLQDGTSPSSASLVLHFRGEAPDDPYHAEQQYLEDAASLRKLRFWNPQLEGGQTDEWQSCLDLLDGIRPSGWRLTSGRSRVISLTYVPQDPGASCALEPDVLQYMLVSGIAPGRAEATAERLAELRIMPRKIGWHALVMRDGMSFSLPKDESFSQLRVFCHSIFLDVMLLVWAQRSAIEELKSEFRKRSVADAAELLKLEISYFNFKRAFWFEYMTLSKTKPIDAILKKFQTQFEMQTEEKRFSSDIIEASRLASSVQAKNAADLARQAALQAEQTQYVQERTNTFIQIVTALLAPLGLSYTGTAVLLDASKEAFWAATLTGVSSTCILLAAGYVQRWWHGRKQKGSKRGPNLPFASNDCWSPRQGTP